MSRFWKNVSRIAALAVGSLTLAAPLFASEADLVVPAFTGTNKTLLLIGIAICVLGMLFGVYEFFKVRAMKVHKSMKDIGNLIFETCKTYLVQQGKFLIILEIFIGLCIAFYFGFLRSFSLSNVLIILAFSVVGILGSYGVAWFGIRMNTLANARTAFASLERKPIKLLNIPLQSRYVYRSSAGISRIDHDALHPALHPRQSGWILFHRFRYR